MIELVSVRQDYCSVRHTVRTDEACPLGRVVFGYDKRGRGRFVGGVGLMTTTKLFNRRGDVSLSGVVSHQGVYRALLVHDGRIAGIRRARAYERLFNWNDLAIMRMGPQCN